MTAITPMLRAVDIVGNYFRDEAAKAKFRTLTRGTPLTLELDPKNEHDPFAVKVLAEGVHLGYVPRTVSGVFHALAAQPGGSPRFVAIAEGAGKFSVGAAS